MLRVGKIVAAHGLKGQVVFTHQLAHNNWLSANDFLFLELNKNSYIPFLVTEARATQSGEFIVALEEVNTVEEARGLIGKAVFVQENKLPAAADDSPLLWIGFTIVDRKHGSLGTIADVLETGHQWLARIDWQGREVLIPLIEPLITDLNLKNRFIRMDLPDGLLDI